MSIMRVRIAFHFHHTGRRNLNNTKTIPHQGISAQQLTFPWQPFPGKSPAQSSPDRTGWRDKRRCCIPPTPSSQAQGGSRGGSCLPGVTAETPKLCCSLIQSRSLRILQDGGWGDAWMFGVHSISGLQTYQNREQILCSQRLYGSQNSLFKKSLCRLWAPTAMPTSRQPLMRYFI